MSVAKNLKKIAIVGGCGHIGLPLGLRFSEKGYEVTLVDNDGTAVDLVNSKKLPFKEVGGQELLARHIGNNLKATLDPDSIREQDVVIFAVDNPYDPRMGHKKQKIFDVVKALSSRLSARQLIILRSTVFPGGFDTVERLLQDGIGLTNLAYCPERVTQGNGVVEITRLPQIVSATTLEAQESATVLFSRLTKKIIYLSPKEAEFAKLICNSWRYVEFAVANHFYMLTESHGLDFHKIFIAMKIDFPRASSFSRPGLSGGPCLLKDSLVLSETHNDFNKLVPWAKNVNEGLPRFMVDQLEMKMGFLNGKKIAILGMTFKPNCDDTSGSLSFQILENLRLKKAEVICSDPFLPDTYGLDETLSLSEGIILGVPHNEYLGLEVSQPYVDCWGIWGNRDPLCFEREF